ncbi:hypothetical protein CKAH01_00041 [Colletotrichum kahawae]|uniref:Uncharacterized protein n=1 Tax=Colletotrichum kahawae TaxID=34407 RepID=A0AAD9YVS6_COLKA|nr:hypothetical protein CKAH01_00041 [Colletotrichum kahawae]
MALLGSCQLPFPFPKQRPGKHRPITTLDHRWFSSILHGACPVLLCRGVVSALEAFLFRPLNPCGHALCRHYWL